MELRDLPKIDELALRPELARYPARVRVEAARSLVAALREKLVHRQPASWSEIDLQREADAQLAPSLRAVINASGVILHTGGGRARLAPAAVAAVRAAAENHANLELDLGSGSRGDRQSHVRSLLCDLTGAPAAFVVNNCAAAVFLALSALCSGKEVILSRGEMVEIGGSFRMPDIILQSGARLVEVGCTNKTRLSDYRAAISAETAAILRCHPSNFKIIGFTESVSVRELATLGPIVIDDAGSGCLADLTALGLPRAELLGESLRHGSAVTMASGDKLLGGPQCGILLGNPELIAKIQSHPLARAVRIDKLSLAALEATLRLYATGEEQTIPTLWALSRPLEGIELAAHKIADTTAGAICEPGLTEVGGGSAPGEGVPTIRVGLPSAAFAAQLRAGDPPVLTYVSKDRTWIDPRTLTDVEVEFVCQRLK